MVCENCDNLNRKVKTELFYGCKKNRASCLYIKGKKINLIYCSSYVPKIEQLEFDFEGKEKRKW